MDWCFTMIELRSLVIQSEYTWLHPSVHETQIRSEQSWRKNVHGRSYPGMDRLVNGTFRPVRHPTLPWFKCDRPSWTKSDQSRPVTLTVRILTCPVLTCFIMGIPRTCLRTCFDTTTTDEELWGGQIILCDICNEHSCARFTKKNSC